MTNNSGLLLSTVLESELMLVICSLSIDLNNCEQMKVLICSGRVVGITYNMMACESVNYLGVGKEQVRSVSTSLVGIESKGRTREEEAAFSIHGFMK